MPAGLGGDVHAGRPLHLDELALDLALQVVAAVLVHEVPLVVGDDEGAAGVDDLGDHAGVLLGERLGRVEQHDGDLRLLDRGLRAQARVEVGTLRLVDASPDAGGVDEPPRDPLELDELVDGVARGARGLVHDDALGARELVEQRRLADVGAPDERDATRPLGERDAVRRLGGQRGHGGIEQVTRPAAVQRRDRVGLTEPEAPQRGRVGLPARSVHLVGAQHHGLLGLAQQPDHVLVGRGRADRRVDDEDHRVRERDGDLGLLGHARVDAGDVDLPAARVDEGEPAAGPLGGVADAVARHAGRVLDDGLAAPEDAVDERGLADVRTPDDGEDGQDLGLLALVLRELADVEEGEVGVVELVLAQAGAQRPLAGRVVGGVGCAVQVVEHAGLRQVGGGHASILPGAGPDDEPRPLSPAAGRRPGAGCRCARSRRARARRARRGWSRRPGRSRPCRSRPPRAPR